MDQPFQRGVVMSKTSLRSDAPRPSIRLRTQIASRSCFLPDLKELVITHMAKRYKVLLIAEAANPEWVSVPLIGWSLARALREVAEVHLVTQVRNRDAILRAGWEEGKDFTSIDSESIARPLWRLASLLRMGDGRGWTTVQAIAAISYPYFEHLVWKALGAQINAGAFDIVHRVTPLSPTTASPIAARVRRAGVPFVVGPLNGGVPWPQGFDAERRREREWLSYVRGIYKLLPSQESTLKADAILIGSRHTGSEIPDRHRARCIYLPENAIDTSRFHLSASYDASPLRACFIGRMVPYKGPDMLIEAAAPLLRAGRMTLDMIGDGPLMEKLKGMAETQELGTAVHFHGWLPHEKVQEVACRSSLFAFPSIREFGGGAVLEAMALGLVPLVVDYAGPSELVTDDNGFKVPLGSRAEIIDGFRRELERIAASPECLGEIGSRARARVHDLFTWQRKAEQIGEVYSWVRGDTLERPQPF